MNKIELCENDNDWTNFMDSMSNTTELNHNNITDYSLNLNNIKINLEKKIDINDIVIDDICEKCDIKCKTLNGIIYCELCGLENKIDVDELTFNSESGNNINSNSFMSFNFIGKNSYCYQRSFLKTCADYSSFRKNNNRKDMYKYNYNYNGNKLPKNVIKLAIELFSKIKEKKYVYRGNGKKGIIGACLFYSCIIPY